MSNFQQLLLAGLAGLSLGLIFYGGLYFTVIRGLNSPHPARWFVTSGLLRIALVVTGFYFVSGGDWRPLVACLTGFILAGVSWMLWRDKQQDSKGYSDQRPTKAPPAS